MRELWFRPFYLIVTTSFEESLVISLALKYWPFFTSSVIDMVEIVI